MNPRCDKCGCSCQGRREAPGASGGARPKKMINNNNISEDRVKVEYSKSKETVGGAGNGGGGKNNNIPEIVYAKFKEDTSSSSSSNEGTLTGRRTRPSPAAVSAVLPPVSPGESSQPSVQPRPSSVQNEDEGRSESQSESAAAQEEMLEPESEPETADGGGDGAAMNGNQQEAELEQRSEGNSPPDQTSAGAREEYNYEDYKYEDSDTDSNEDFVAPWLRPSGRERVLDDNTRAKVLDWLENIEKAAAEEVDGPSAIPYDFDNHAPEEKPKEEKEKKPSKTAELRKKEVDEKTRRIQEDVLRAGDKLPVVQGKQVELLSNVEYLPQLNPHYLAVTLCALLNSGGGHIYSGVDADQVIRGTRIHRAERDRTRQMLDIISRDNIEPPISPAETDIEFLVAAGLKEDERVMKVTVSHVVTNIPYRVQRMDGSGFENGVYIRTSEGGNKHVKM